jgi:hypothetical protein
MSSHTRTLCMYVGGIYWFHALFHQLQGSFLNLQTTAFKLYFGFITYSLHVHCYYIIPNMNKKKKKKKDQEVKIQPFFFLVLLGLIRLVNNRRIVLFFILLFF